MVICSPRSVTASLVRKSNLLLMLPTRRPRYPLTALLTAFIGCLLLPGCVSPEAMLRKATPPTVDAYAQSLIRSLAAGDSSPISRSLDPIQKTPTTDQQLAALTAEARKHPISEITLVGYHQMTMNGVTDRTLNYQIRFTDGWGEAEVQLREAPGGQLIELFRVGSIPASMQETNGLHLWSKSPLHYLFLLLFLACALFMLSAAVLAFRIRGGRRWLRLLVALVGLCQIGFNWTTGVIGFNPLTIQLIGIYFGRFSAYAPFVIAFPIPVGAFWIWWNYLASRGAFPANAPAGSTPDGANPTAPDEPAPADLVPTVPDAAAPSEPRSRPEEPPAAP